MHAARERPQVGLHQLLELCVIHAPGQDIARWGLRRFGHGRKLLPCIIPKDDGAGEWARVWRGVGGMPVAHSHPI
jgi:hypothetical protein